MVFSPRRTPAFRKSSNPMACIARNNALECIAHIMDPIRFEQDLRVTIQALGWRKGGY